MSADRRKVLLVLAVALLCSLAATDRSQPTEDSCRKFVQAFYDWYVPKAQDVHGDPLDLTLRRKPAPFSAELVRGLDRVEAESKADNDAGLDFDPVLNTQDPGDPGDSYVIVKATYRDGACSVELHSKFRNTSDVAIVVPELRFEQGRWVFVNFHYPDSTDKRSENLRNLIKNYLAPSPTSP